MTDVPKDVLKIAIENAANHDKLVLDDETVSAIASIILAERERCALLAKAYLEDIAGCDLKDDEPELIYAAIKAGGSK